MILPVIPLSYFWIHFLFWASTWHISWPPNLIKSPFVDFSFIAYIMLEKQASTPGSSLLSLA